MLSIWTLLATAVCAVAVSPVNRRTVIYGRQLSLDLPERTKRLVFVSADESEENTIWERKTISWTNKPTKGELSSAHEGWTFRIVRVTFEDQGSYIIYNDFGSTISNYVVTVQSKREIINCIAGETLTISLEGLKQADATLHFYNNYSSVTLVQNGLPVGQSHPDYINRLKVSSRNIQILNVNTSDIGIYEITDLKRRLVSNNTMILVDHHDFTPNKGLLALLLLGIPGGICFCCRNRICKRCRKSKSYSGTEQPNTVPLTVPCSNNVTDPAGPVGPIGPVAPVGPIGPAGPVGPGNPGQGYNAGYPPHPDQGPVHYPYPSESGGQPAVPPNSGFYPGYVPQNPVYPPTYGPGAPPDQPPQWNAPPPQYNPSAPMNYTPVMSSGPPQPATELPPTVPLLSPQPESQPSAKSSISTDILNSSDSGVQFDINKGKSSGNNFL